MDAFGHTARKTRRTASRIADVGGLHAVARTCTNDISNARCHHTTDDLGGYGKHFLPSTRHGTHSIPLESSSGDRRNRE